VLTATRVHDGKLFEGGDEAEGTGRPGFTWLDLSGPTEAALAPLAARFGLHPLALEDCLHLDQRPKLEDYPGHEFVVLQGFGVSGPDVVEVELQELHFFIGDQWLLTVHEGPLAAVAAVQQRVKADPSATLGKGPDFVAYLLADALVDQHFPLLDQLSEQLETLEDRIFDSPTRDLMQEAFRLKRLLVTLRRVLSPQRDVVGLLARRGVPHVQERTALYFRDVYDHLVRVAEQLEAARDLVSSVMEVYLSVIANRTGDITKQLTIFASIFMPLSFIVGFFGENFEGIAPHAMFWPAMVTMALVPVGMLMWFKHKGWS
jgi:magnesium transporter